MDKNKGVKIPVQVRVNMWLGLSAHEKKLNSFAQGTFSVFAEMVKYLQYGFADIKKDTKKLCTNNTLISGLLG